MLVQNLLTTSLLNFHGCGNILLILHLKRINNPDRKIIDTFFSYVEKLMKLWFLCTNQPHPVLPQLVQTNISWPILLVIFTDVVNVVLSPVLYVNKVFSSRLQNKQQQPENLARNSFCFDSWLPVNHIKFLTCNQYCLYSSLDTRSYFCIIF